MTGQHRGSWTPKRAGVIGGAVIIIAGLGATAVTLSLGGPANAAQLPGTCPASTSSAIASEATAAMARRALAETPAAAAVAPLPGAAQGIDVSSFNTVTSWASVRQAGMSFVGIKATEGDYYTNEPPTSTPGYGAEVAAATAAGLYVMPYAFANPYQGDGTSAHPSNGSGTCQADYAWNEIAAAAPAYGSSSLMLPAVLDVENDPYTATEPGSNACYGMSASSLVSWITDFLNRMQANSGKKPIIYTSSDFWQTCTGNTTAFSSYPLWIAAYDVASPTVPPAWNNPAFWQYSQSGTGIAGGSSPVDLDYLGPILQASTVGTAVKQVQLRTLTSLNAQGASTVSYSAAPGGLPPGLSVSPGGLISGTPTQVGSYAGHVSTTGVPSTISFTWNVNGIITLSPQPARSTTAGYPTATQVNATDGNAARPGYTPPKFTAAGLPPGLSISSAGAITGWPAAAGTYSVKVTATDGFNATASASFTWTINPAPATGTAGTIRQHSGSNLCLDDPSSKTANGTGIDLATCNGKSSQTWTAAQDGTIRVLGHCLEATSTSLILMTCNTSAAEQWKAGTYGALASVRYGTCLNGPSAAAQSGTRPTLATCQNSASKVDQHWTRPWAPVVSGVAARCLGVDSSSAAVVLTCSNVSTQHWMTAPAGTFAIQSTGKCLAEAGQTAGSAIVTSTCNNTTPSQQWRLVAAGNIATQLKSAASGLCVTASSASSSGTKLVLGSCSTALASTWRVA